MSDLAKLEASVAELRKAREVLNTESRRLHAEARKLSPQILAGERAIAEIKALAKARRVAPGTIVLTVEAAKLSLKPKG
jgi:hypothetical protein